uniref:NADH-ubiquinone oxidoreductase chain 4 n=1 Tax=Dreissena rostriformis TaxID=205083 RepID=A0A894JLJ3_9BIVA|nr:NADH dehydrogenase subunit 4 [Dreissena rostriformis]QRV59721.1 NADH dehydrogenase subunit 4 [Dreissena rostriformis]
MLSMIYSTVFMSFLGFFQMSGGILVFSLSLIVVMFFCFFMSSSPVMFCDYFFLVDNLSILMIVMSFFVILSSLVSSCKDLYLSEKVTQKNKIKSTSFGFEGAVLMVFMCCIAVFSSKNIFCFYVFFELSLLPTLWLILSWGNNPERLQAGVAMMLYTVCGSIPLLMILISSYLWFGTPEFLSMKLSSQDGLKHYSSYAGLVWVIMVMGFFIKLPVFFFHSWLPQAHVEAPLAGSMILAGVLLKLGAFGAMRFFWVLGSWNLTFIYYFFMILALYGGVLTSIFCVCQSDIKSLIAYSSIGHMGVCLVGVMSMSNVGWAGAACLLFAHGLCSPLLFSMAGSMYQWTYSQSISLNKGVLLTFPSFALFWMASCILNMSFPPSLNFLGEVLLVCSGVHVFSWFGLLLGFLCFFAAVYCLYLYVSVCHGTVSNIIQPLSFLSERYIYSGFFLICPLAFGFMSSDFFMV